MAHRLRSAKKNAWSTVLFSITIVPMSRYEPKRQKARQMNRRNFLKALGVGASVAVGGCMNTRRLSEGERPAERPNILFCISDDQSWLHTGIWGDKMVKTPNFDRVAREGVLFRHAFCCAPSCTPSRSGILTGQEIWRLEQGGTLFGTLPAKFEVYPDLLERAGYHVGFTRKGWSPGRVRPGGRERNPAGPRYENFEQFLKARPQGKPFCFWFGSSDPHRGYEWQSGVKSGMKLEDVVVPACLPDSEEVRTDICDYYWEIQKFDREVGQILKMLEERGELEKTLVVITSDNGMPFPRAKATLYDLGVRMPLAIRWPAKVKGGRVVDDFVSLSDIAPTFLEAAGVEVPEEMTGRSLIALLLSGKSGTVEPSRDRVFTAIERHAWCRPDGIGYPSRAIRTHRWLYIRNYEPDRWSAGDPDFNSPHQGGYGDIDNGPTKTYMMQHKDNPNVAPRFQLGFGKRPAEELYDVINDPDQIRNLAADSAFAEVKKKLRDQLEQYQRDTKDPRAEGKSPWEHYPYYYKDYWKRAARSAE